MKSNKELYNNFFNKIDVTEGDLIGMIQTQYNEGETFMSNKRDELDTNFEIYKNVLEKEGDVGDETTFATVNALIARSISEEFRGEFISDDTRTQITAENLNNMLSQDYDSDDMLSVDLYGLLFKYIMGVFIKIEIGWNGITKTPIFNFVDPRSWIPDPNGDYSTGQFSYSGISSLIGEFAIDKNRLDYENLKPIQGGFSTNLAKFRDQQLEGFVSPGSNVHNNYYDIYYHYFYITDKKGDKRKAFAILGNDRSLILHLELYEKFTDGIVEEFPLSFEYYGFEINNVLGDNVVKHTAEPQKVKALMRNLRIKKAKAGLYPMYFYNDKYVSKSKLAFGFNKFIPVSTKEDGPVDLNSIITSFRPNETADNSYIVDQDLDKQVERATSIGPNITGATQDKIDNTATESTIVQSNSDINIAYREKIANIGKKQFMRVWYQAYLRYFEEGDKKIIMQDNGIGVTPVEIKKKDFYLKAYNKIRVRSKTQVEIQRRKDIQAIQSLVNLVVSMDTIDNYQKLLLIRDLGEALGYSKAKINTRLSGGPEEELIKQENQILDEGLFFPISPDDNHLMHIILQKPIDENKESSVIHFQSHIVEWIKQGKPINSTVNGTQQAIQGSMASSNQAQLNQGSPNNTPITT